MNQDVVHARSVRAVQVLCRLRTARPHREFLRRVVRKSPRHLGDSSGAPEDLRRDVPSPDSSGVPTRIPAAHRRNTACSPERYREECCSLSSLADEWRQRFSNDWPQERRRNGRGRDPRSRHGPATGADGLASHRGLSAGRRDSHTAIPRVVALCGVDGDGAVSASRGERVRRLA